MTTHTTRENLNIEFHRDDDGSILIAETVDRA